jgi:hypothetical protein
MTQLSPTLVARPWSHFGRAALVPLWSHIRACTNKKRLTSYETVQVLRTFERDALILGVRTLIIMLTSGCHWQRVYSTGGST